MARPRRNGLPKALPDGFILTDTETRRWRVGGAIGHGGCGLIYLASRMTERPVAEDSEWVIKVEYQENGPLFTELKFYQRAAKAESVQKWKESRKLDVLGIPSFLGQGLAEHNGLRYRFMVMERLGTDLQKVIERNGGGRLRKETVLQLGIRLVDILEFIHEKEYVHGDIKAANLLLGYRDPQQVYLVDYGLSYRYCPNGVHKEYKEKPRKSPDGTLLYTSMDAHRGVDNSRRGDLQILGFCLLHWLVGGLPWDHVLKFSLKVQEEKSRLMEGLPQSVKGLSAGGANTDEVADFLFYVGTLDYQDRPDYQRVRRLLCRSARTPLDLSAPPSTEPLDPSAPPSREQRSGVKAVTSEVKVKAISSRYLRGPPLTPAPPPQKGTAAGSTDGKGAAPPPPVRRRPKPKQNKEKIVTSAAPPTTRPHLRRDTEEEHRWRREEEEHGWRREEEEHGWRREEEHRWRREEEHGWRREEEHGWRREEEHRWRREEEHGWREEPLPQTQGAPSVGAWLVVVMLLLLGVVILSV